MKTDMEKRWYPMAIRVAAGAAAGTAGGYAVQAAAEGVPGLPPFAGTLAFWAVFAGALSKGLAAANRLRQTKGGNS